MPLSSWASKPWVNATTLEVKKRARIHFLFLTAGVIERWEEIKGYMKSYNEILSTKVCRFHKM
jgi:hypothetical protein